MSRPRMKALIFVTGKFLAYARFVVLVRFVVNLFTEVLRLPIRVLDNFFEIV
jgi:hypothetical protein